MNDLHSDDENRWEEQSSGPKLLHLWCPAETARYKKWNKTKNEISLIFGWLKFCNKHLFLIPLLSGIPTQWTVPLFCLVFCFLVVDLFSAPRSDPKHVYLFSIQLLIALPFHSLAFLWLELFLSSVWIQFLFSSLLIVCGSWFIDSFLFYDDAVDFWFELYKVHSVYMQLWPTLISSYLTPWTC